ncbi:MAG: caspase family protein, partial [Spirochaetales bacterium]|nr:caspase family protein [Spirochaetales bacterium]
MMKRFFLAAGCAACIFAVSAAFPHTACADAKSLESSTRRFGLFIGSNRGGAGRAVLRYAASDAQALASVFAQMGGIAGGDSVLLLDPSAEALTRRIDELREEVSRAKKVHKRTEIIFYYSGHSDEEGLLLDSERYSYRQLRERVNTVPSDMRIVILDSCSSGAFTRAKGGSKTKPFLIDSSVSAEGYAFLTSSSAEESSQESDRIRSSYFTHSLLTGLRGAADTVGDGRVTLNELYRFAYSETLAKTETSRYGAQHPSYDIQVNGTGDVVLTDIRETSAGLILGPDVEGRLSIRDKADHLIAEITKSGSRPVELGLEGGVYRITLQTEGKVFRAEVSLAEGMRRTVSRADFEFFASSPAVARGNGNEELPYVPVGVQLVPGLGTAKADNVFLLGVLLGEGYNLSVGGISGLGLIHDGGVRGGFQISGIFNIVSGGIKGAQYAGIFNTTGGDLSGVQYAGIFNTASSLKGMQGAGAFNSVRGSVYGFQGAGFFNHAGESLCGFQGAVFGNYAGAEVQGMQAGLVNYTAAGFSGFQAGLVNYSARAFAGVQAGLVNIGGEGPGQGVQLGLVNISDDEKTIPIGAVNIIKNGITAPLLWTDSMKFINVGLKSGSRHFYTLLGSGARYSTGLRGVVSDPPDDEESLLSWRAGVGFEISFGRFFVNLDLLGGMIFDDHFSENRLAASDAENIFEASATQFHQARLTLGFNVFRHLGVFAGATLDYLQPLSSTSPVPSSGAKLYENTRNILR